MKHDFIKTSLMIKKIIDQWKVTNKKLNKVKNFTYWNTCWNVMKYGFKREVAKKLVSSNDTSWKYIGRNYIRSLYENYLTN